MIDPRRSRQVSPTPLTRQALRWNTYDLIMPARCSNTCSRSVFLELIATSFEVVTAANTGRRRVDVRGFVAGESAVSTFRQASTQRVSVTNTHCGCLLCFIRRFRSNFDDVSMMTSTADPLDVWEDLRRRIRGIDGPHSDRRSAIEALVSDHVLHWNVPISLAPSNRCLQRYNRAASQPAAILHHRSAAQHCQPHCAAAAATAHRNARNRPPPPLPLWRPLLLRLWARRGCLVRRSSCPASPKTMTISALLSFALLSSSHFDQAGSFTFVAVTCPMTSDNFGMIDTGTREHPANAPAADRTERVKLCSPSARAVSNMTIDATFRQT